MAEYKRGRAINGNSADDAGNETWSICEILSTDTNEAIGDGVFYDDEKSSPIYYLKEGGRLIAHKDQEAFSKHSEAPFFLRMVHNIENLKKITENKNSGLIAEDILNDKKVQERLGIDLSNVAPKNDE